MKFLKKFLVCFLAALILCTSACGRQPNATSGSTSTTAAPQIPNNKTTCYNIIFALATIPPVLAALDSIANGYETYAIIERGKTYNGIESLEYFHNAGFDPNNNLSTGFTAEEFNAMSEKIKELKGKDVYFNIYVQDGTALMGAGIAANAGLTEGDFHVYMCEDGTGAYNALYNTYIKDKVVNAEKDEVYKNFLDAVENAKADFESVMAKTDNQCGDGVFGYNIGKAYALAALPNFTYYIQEESTVASIIGRTGATQTKLGACFGIDGYNYDVEYKLNLKYGKISNAVDALSAEEREDYLTLMYGEYYAATYEALTRTERAGVNAPSKKLVFIGSRHDGYPDLASKAEYGVGGLYNVPLTYDELDEKYKTELLFATEEDYNVFLAVINNMENYSDGASEAAIFAARWACFNYYIDYIYTLKLTYALYGEEYDIIMKGHPREVIGAHEEWGERYRVAYGNDEDGNKLLYSFDKLMDNALLAFHESDSVGKYIGMVPYGTSAENLAYLGADIAICGLPSSTYNGYDTDVDVIFVLSETNEDIAGDASQVKTRYEAGNLTYTDASGEVKTTVFYNIGNIYKAAAEVYAKAGNTKMAEKYETLFAEWLAANHPEAGNINEQGFAVK
ncbi:MAG: hypothetical protein IJX55_09900 [Clostridia bacterium]|nr:hypothetical protein [Clostridia bacterium]